MEKYLVTGATGNIGKYVVDNLLEFDKKVKAGVRSLKSIDKLEEQENLELIEFDFLNEKTFENALEGVQGIFLVRPPQLANPKEDMLPFLKKVKEKNIEKIVFVSLLGVEKNPIVPHRKIEDMIRDLRIPYVFLRPSFFMQNLNTNHLDEIRDRDEIFIPAGDAKTSFIDTRDIGLAASITLTQDKYKNQSFTLTGDRAIDYREVSNIMSEVLNKDIDYKNPNLLEFRRERINKGTKKEFANVMTLLYIMTKLGTAKRVTDDLEKIIGRKPTSFKKYVEDYSYYWEG